MDKIPQEENFDVGPFSMLLSSVRLNEPVVVACRNNRKLVGRVKAFDRHLNLVMEQVSENWSEKSKGDKKVTVKERYFPKLFLRGDTVVFIVKAPNLS